MDLEYTMRTNHDIEPRVSVLEKGQESLQNELRSLAQSVKEQGRQLETAIVDMSKSHIMNFNQLSEKIAGMAKTDWQTIVAFLGVGCIVITAVFSPVWMAFSYNSKVQDDIQKEIEKMNVVITGGTKDRAELNVKVDFINKYGTDAYLKEKVLQEERRLDKRQP